MSKLLVNPPPNMAYVDKMIVSPRWKIYATVKRIFYTSNRREALETAKNLDCKLHVAGKAPDAQAFYLVRPTSGNENKFMARDKFEKKFMQSP